MSPGSREVLDRLFNALWREGLSSSRRLSRSCPSAGLKAVLRMPDGAEILAHVEALYAMDRLRTAPPYYMRRPRSGVEPLKRPEDLADFLPAGNGAKRLLGEAAQSARHLDLFLLHARKRAADLRAKKGARGAFLERVFNGRAGFRDAPPEVYLESWILHGHPLHPGTKTRSGFDAEHIRSYSPELGVVVPMNFVAVRRSHTQESRSDISEPSHYAKSWTPRIEEALANKRLFPRDYEVLAVHPWQMERVLPGLFRQEMDEGIVVPLPCRLDARPLVSVRTMVPCGEPDACHLKVPLAVQTTSAVRTVSAPSVHNGPAFSDFVQWILAREPKLQGKLELLAEVRGLHFWQPGAPPTNPATLERARHLSLIFRQPIRQCPGSWAVPAALLPEASPVDSRPVVAELAERSGLSTPRYFAAYTRLTAEAVLAPLARYGLALEAHAQNCLIRFKDGLPIALVARDLGGLRFYRSWIKESGFDLRLHEATRIEATSVEDLVAKTHHAWLQGHLGPVAAALSRTAGTSEERLWREARSEVHAVWEGLKPAIPETRRQELERFLFRPRMKVKALSRMRMNDKIYTYDLCEVDNPLA